MIRLAIKTLEAPAAHAAAARSALNQWPVDHPGQWTDEWMLLLASLLFTRPEQLSRFDVVPLGAILLRPDSSGHSYRLASGLLEALLTTTLAQPTLDVVLDVLRHPTCQPTACLAAIGCLTHAALWARNLLNPEAVMELAELDHLEPHRLVLAQTVVEPLLLSVPATSQGLVDRLALLYEEPAAARYGAYFLRGKDNLPPALRSTFSLHSTTTELDRGARRVLIMHNIGHGLGDEILRCVPLAQSFLDGNPDLEVTVVTRREFLYSHPRITTVSIGDHSQIDRLRDERFDAVIDFVHPFAPASSDSLWEEAVQATIGLHPPFLFVWGTNTDNQFVFERVEVASRPVARVLQLDRRRVENAYETTFRLIAELGLPLRCGTAAPRSEWVLAGERWPQAEAEWRDVTVSNVDKRPVAVLIPFGGAHPLKGYDSAAGVVAEVRLLLGGGYFVVILPNGTAWGDVATAGRALQSLTPGEKARVAVGRDPSHHHGPAPEIPRVPSLSHLDYAMRLTVYWLSYADRVVTVEGWTMHAAYCLGKPYRALTFPYSEPDEWCPYGQTEHQTVCSAFAPPTDLLDRLRPNQPRKQLLLLLLNEIGAVGLDEASPLFRSSMKSSDRDVRQAAANGLTRCPTQDIGTFIGLLSDPSREVRGIAARLLLDRGFTSRRVSHEQLTAHVLIGAEKLDWRAVIALGRAIAPVLQIAGRGDEPSVCREARSILRMLERQGLLSRILARSSSWVARTRDVG